jgi:uncharacterized repeat protein (TIGR01451 family)
MNKQSANGVLKGLFLVFALFSLLLVREARAVHRGAAGDSDTPVDTEITNKAIAEYTDANGVTQTAESNPVVTTVAQVFDVDLGTSATELSPIGVQVTFPHTVTNTGNGPDSYTLTAVEDETSDDATASSGDDFDFSNVEIYADSTCDGVPDNAISITTTPVLAPGQVFCFIVAANVPGTALDGQIEGMTITATSVSSGTATDTNTDLVEVTTDAVIDVLKSLDIAEGEEGQIFTYTISYTNKGNATATGVTISDLIPSGLEYVDGSGRWSASGATPLGDPAAGVDQTVGATTMTYSASAAPLTGATLVTAIVSEVGPGASGFITFQVQVLSTITNAPAPILNGGSDDLVSPANEDGEVVVSYNDGTTTQETTTNVVLFEVLLTSDVDGTGDTQASTPQGSVFTFENVFTNNGSGPDTFNITITSGVSTFPVGTTFAFQDSSGNPLLDTNSPADGIVDTGEVAAGASVTVVVVVTLPTGATGGPFTFGKTATSTGDPDSADPSQMVTDMLTLITAAVVDVTNTDPGSIATLEQGDGSGTTAIITTLSTDPGGSVTFEIFVNNESVASDVYDLTHTALPAGWSLTFFAATVGVDTGGISDCGNTPVPGTDPIPAGSFQKICAEVTVTGEEVPGNTDITFTATSPTTGASDFKVDRVTVNEVREIQLSANQGSTVSPNGSVSYIHTLSSNGNVTETNINISTVDSLSADGWTSSVYLDGDSNGDGVVDAAPDGDPSNDTLISSAGVVLVPIDVAAYSSVFLIVQVSAPLSAAVPDVDVTTITATATLVSTAPTPPAVNNTDTTTVTAGSVTLEKTQGLDIDCDGGTVDANEIALTPLPINTAFSAPDTCILYRIVATNVGNLPVTGLTVTDSVLTNTSYETSCGAAATTVGTITTVPADEATSGDIVATIGTLAASAQATVTFCLQID